MFYLKTALKYALNSQEKRMWACHKQSWNENAELNAELNAGSKLMKLELNNHTHTKKKSNTKIFRNGFTKWNVFSNKWDKVSNS